MSSDECIFNRAIFGDCFLTTLGTIARYLCKSDNGHYMWIQGWTKPVLCLDDGNITDNDMQDDTFKIVSKCKEPENDDGTTIEERANICAKYIHEHPEIELKQAISYCLRLQSEEDVKRACIYMQTYFEGQLSKEFLQELRYVITEEKMDEETKSNPVKPEDVMLNDWFKLRNNHFEWITNAKIDRQYLSLIAKDISGFFIFEPIEITRDFLELNGFTEFYKNDMFCNLSCDSSKNPSLKGHIEINHLNNDGSGKLELVYMRNETQVSMKVRYIHELQHILRDVEENEFANSLKIK